MTDKKKTINIGDLVISLVVETRMKENDYILCHRASNGNIHYSGYLDGGYIEGTRYEEDEEQAN